MNDAKKRRFEAAGFKVGTVQEFLDLTDLEAAMIELRLALARALRTRRTEAALSQIALAQRLGSSQSRVAKMENADPGVSVDLLLRALYALGASSRDVAKAIARAKGPTAAARGKRRASG